MSSSFASKNPHQHRDELAKVLIGGMRQASFHINK